MVRTPYSYPATLEKDDDGRYVVRFPDLPEALTDGADEEDAIAEAADCLSEVLASRIVDGEEIPSPNFCPGRYMVSPDPTIALKAALYTALRRRDMTVADLADRLGLGDWHQAARLIDPKRSSKLTRLAAALEALGCTIEIAINEHLVSQDPAREELLARLTVELSPERIGTLSRSDLAKVVEAAVQAYFVGTQSEVNPITRLNLTASLIERLLEGPSPAGQQHEPPANTRRWVSRRKAAVVNAVRSGRITLEEALRRYQLTEEEYRSWEPPVTTSDRPSRAEPKGRRSRPQR
jgi:antitoxin HicB